jgi:hypothetical protein
MCGSDLAEKDADFGILGQFLFHFVGFVRFIELLAKIRFKDCCDGRSSAAVTKSVGALGY